MEIRFFQIIVPLLSLIFVVGLTTRYRKGRINLREYLFSLVFWLGLAVFSLFPGFSVLPVTSMRSFSSVWES